MPIPALTTSQIDQFFFPVGFYKILSPVVPKYVALTFPVVGLNSTTYDFIKKYISFSHNNPFKFGNDDTNILVSRINNPVFFKAFLLLYGPECVPNFDHVPLNLTQIVNTILTGLWDLIKCLK